MGHCFKIQVKNHRRVAAQITLSMSSESGAKTLPVVVPCGRLAVEVAHSETPRALIAYHLSASQVFKHNVLKHPSSVWEGLAAQQSWKSASARSSTCAMTRIAFVDSRE